MTVYVDARALLVDGAASPGAARLAPDAASAMGHLSEAGLEVVLVGGDDAIAGLGEVLPDRARLPGLPEDPQGWMIAGDAEACARSRPCRHLRTILVHPTAPAAGRLASRACDEEARDLTAAALTILAAEAMEPARGRAGSGAAMDATAPTGTSRPARMP